MISSFLLLLLFIPTTMAEPCNDIICTTTYIKRGGLKPVGCNQITASRSELSCAVTCFSSQNCAAYLYASQSGSCSICQAGQIQSLNFTSSETFSWPQQMKEKWPLDNTVTKHTDRSTIVPIDVNIGTVVHLQGYYYKYDGFYIEFRQDPPGNNVILQFRARRDYYSQNLTLVLAHRSNTQWATEYKPPFTTYPFVENTPTTVDILVAKDGYQVYIDQTFCCFYNHVMAYERTQYLRITGYIEVYELRV